MKLTKLHPIDTMPVNKSVLVYMKVNDKSFREWYGRSTYYYVCHKDKNGHLIEDAGECYADFSEDEATKLLGWVSLDELDEIFNVKEK